MFKAEMLRSAWHLQRKGNNEMIIRIIDSKLEGSWSVGRPNLRWMDGWCDGRYEEDGDGRQG